MLTVKLKKYEIRHLQRGNPDFYACYYSATILTCYDHICRGEPAWFFSFFAIINVIVKILQNKQNK